MGFVEWTASGTLYNKASGAFAIRVGITEIA